MRDAPLEVIYEGKDLEALASLRNYQNWIVDKFLPYLKGRTIEFGSGIGNMSVLISPHVDSLDLVEPSAALLPALEQRIPGTETIKIYCDTLETRLIDTPDETYDTAVLINVLEHIEDDAAALCGLLRILRPGGHLLLFIPALRFLYSKLDAQHGHYRRYHRKELHAQVVYAGFDMVQSCYFDLLGVVPWWILNTLMKSTSFNPVLAKTYDRIFVPLTRGLENLIAPPIGKNVMLVAKRPNGQQ